MNVVKFIRMVDACVSHAIGRSKLSPRMAPGAVVATRRFRIVETVRKTVF